MRAVSTSCRTILGGFVDVVLHLYSAYEVEKEKIINELQQFKGVKNNHQTTEGIELKVIFLFTIIARQQTFTFLGSSS